MSKNDLEYMALAIQLARKGLHSTGPNPRVGCVLVKDGEIIGQGYHVQAGFGHAEVNAMADADSRAKAQGHSLQGATAYVTLEPCSHTGRTGPCAVALAEAKVARVVIGCQDPNPKVAGKGIKILEDAGISVEVGVLEQEAEALNKGFNKRMTQKLPRVMAKIASSLDGRTAMASGESKWITGPDSRQDVQRLRAQSCAIITGIGTVLDDNPSLSVRDERFLFVSPETGENIYRQPLKVIVDSKLQIEVDADIFRGNGRKLVAIAADPKEQEAKVAQLNSIGVDTIHLPNDGGKVDLGDLLQHLATLECNEVMIEAGARLTGVFLQQGLIDEIVYYIAPTLLGSDGRPQVELPLETMSEQIKLDITDLSMVSNDIRITATPRYVNE